jgi:tRNA pseudouridine38-40 synthase
VISVQEVIETTLTKVLKTPTTIFGCGRTDAQVHASQYFFHADLDWKGEFDLKSRLNQVLPPDIAIFDILEVDDSRNARFDAVKRTYDYFLHTYKDPFLHETSTYYAFGNLDLVKMQEAAQLLLRYNDFYAFSKAPDDNDHTRCQIQSAGFFVDGRGDRIRFQISSDRFLRGMIRILMDRFLSVGMGKLRVEEFESYLILKKAPGQIKLAYPQGLFLSKVVYPYLDLPMRVDFSTMHRPQADTSWIPI